MKKFLSLACLLLLAAGGISTSVVLSSKNQTYTPSFAYYSPGTTYTNGDGATYYNSINKSLTGSSLLEALQGLNKTKRKKTVSYESMSTSVDGSAYVYTDYDPNYVTTDSNGQPYGTKVLSFYTYTSTTSWNREHVWPNSRGGGKNGSAPAPYVDADIHVTRPTISSENSSRGNSFFVEGMNHSANGWDPYTAGYDAKSRGEAARIIFYCMVADSDLLLIDSNTLSSSQSNYGKTMGKLSDLIKWHLNYEITQRENNRNEGAEYLQGNRNPFVDHPEYVCKIWGNTNSATQALCANDPYAKSAPTAITLNKSSDSIKVTQTLQLEVASITPDDADGSVSWSTSNSSVATVSTSGLVAGVSVGSATITATSTKNSSITATCQVTVTAPDNVDLQDISLSPASIAVLVGGNSQISVTTSPSFVYPAASVSYSSSNTSIATVSNSGLVSGVAAGTTTITVTATQGSIQKSKTVGVTVSQPTEPEYTLVTSNSALSTDDRVVIATGLENSDEGVTGCDGPRDAATSTDKKEWKEYVVQDAISSGFKLYDEEEPQYIASPTSNEFKYSDNAGICSVDSSGHLKSNNRYLCINSGSYYRFYSDIGEYEPFFVYKYAVPEPVIDNPGTDDPGTETPGTDNPPVDNPGTDTPGTDTPGTDNPPVDNPGTDNPPVDNPGTDNPGTDTPGTNVVSVVDVYLNKSGVELEVGQTIELIATVLPENATNTACSWFSNNETIAKVSSMGLVTAIGVGTATISVVTADGGKTATCRITVKKTVKENEGGSTKPCGGNIVATSIVLSSISLMGIVLISIKKKRIK